MVLKNHNLIPALCWIHSQILNSTLRYGIINIYKLKQKERNLSMAILLAAPIGAGKSTVAQTIADMKGLDIIFESVNDNPILPLYYQDRRRYGFQLQMYFLQRRVRDMMIGYSLESTNKPIISDRSIIEDKDIFVKQLADSNMLSDTEYELYNQSANTNLQLLDSYRQLHGATNDDLLIFLNPSFQRTLDQIKKRGRDFEQFDNNPELKAYYEDIYNRYQDWFQTYHRTPKIELTDYDTTSAKNKEKLYQIIKEKATTVGINIF